MSAADVTRFVAVDTAARDEASRWHLAFMAMSLALGITILALLSVSQQRDEARATAVQMWPDYVKGSGATSWIVPCPCGEMDIGGLEWMPREAVSP